MRHIQLLILASFAFVSGCTTIRVDSLAPLVGYSSAIYEPGTQRRTVDVSALNPILARATWTNRESFSKGGFWLKYPNGREFFFAVGFSFFRERGVPGQFEVLAQDVQEYRSEIDRLRKL